MKKSLKVTFIFSLAILFLAVSYSVQVFAAKKVLPTTIENRIKIPKIKVNAIVEPVGLTSNGAVDSPIGPAGVGWFSLGPRVGEIGNAIMDGHSGWKGGQPAVFDNLYKLVKGDRIYVQNEKGITSTYIVRQVKKYNPNAVATDVFVSTDGKAHLNLITCGGVWNKVSKSHSNRIVVFTDLLYTK